MLDLINILMSSENTKAWINATNNHCIYKIIGNHIGNSSHLSNPAVIAANHGTNNHRRIDHEIIFPYNLNERDITLAIVQIISSIQRNNEIPISNIFAIIFIG